MPCSGAGLFLVHELLEGNPVLDRDLITFLCINPFNQSADDHMPDLVLGSVVKLAPGAQPIDMRLGSLFLVLLLYPVSGLFHFTLSGFQLLPVFHEHSVDHLQIQLTLAGESFHCFFTIVPKASVTVICSTETAFPSTAF